VSPRRCLVFGGTGFIGTKLVLHLAATERFDEVIVVDVKPPRTPLPSRTRFVHHDVRLPVAGELSGLPAEWIFNLAAVHREPGHAASEYFDTNVKGARNVCAHATAIDCRRIYFTSSIACYGSVLSQPRDEGSPLLPASAYGRSKQAAELVHETWLLGGPHRRLVVCRPGAVYGPGDPGNILRLIRAVQRRRFCFAGDPDVRKSCGYVYELIATIDFMLDRSESHILYNFANPTTPTLRDMVLMSAAITGTRANFLRLPMPAVLLAAHLANRLTRGRSPLHPVRVRKSATPTHVVPARLGQLGFPFRYDFASAVRHWRQVAPQDFA